MREWGRKTKLILSIEYLHMYVFMYENLTYKIFALKVSKCLLLYLLFLL